MIFIVGKFGRIATYNKKQKVLNFLPRVLFSFGIYVHGLCFFFFFFVLDLEYETTKKCIQLLHKIFQMVGICETNNQHIAIDNQPVCYGRKL